MVDPAELLARCQQTVNRMDAIPERHKEDAAMFVVEALLRADVLNWEFLATSRIQQKAIDYIRKLNREEYPVSQYWGDWSDTDDHDDLGLNKCEEDEHVVEDGFDDVVKDILERLSGLMVTEKSSVRRGIVRLAFQLLKVCLEDTDACDSVMDSASEMKIQGDCTKYRKGQISTKYLQIRFPDAKRKHIIQAKQLLQDVVRDSYADRGINIC